MQREDKIALIEYRVKGAKDALEDARFLMDAARYSAAMNRMYYACYYAALALMLNKDIVAKTHAGVLSMLGLHFIRTGILPSHLGKAFCLIFQKRHSKDYDDFVECTLEELEQLFPLAQEFIDFIVSYLLQNPYREEKDNQQE